MKALLENVVQQLVDNPDKIEIREDSTDSSIQLDLRVEESDMGKVIGKGGRIAKAIRLLLRAAGQKSGKKINLKILD